MNSNVITLTIENFQQIMVEESKQKLVLVTFWADQVPESLELRDVFIQAVQGLDEHILLATVDCQTEQQIPQQFGIQALPTAVLVKDGQPLDGLSGPQDNEAVQAFLDKHLPKPQDGLLVSAKQLLEAGDVNGAFTDITKAYQLDNDRADIKLVLADVYIQTGKIAEAETLLATITMVDQDSDYQALMAKLELASQAADSPEIKLLEAEFAKQPDNTELVHQLAAQYSQVNRHEDALALLFSAVQKDGSDVKSKELLLDVLKALPDGDALATKYRRKLYTLMY